MEWFYSLPPRSFHNFSEITEAFLAQYAIHQKDKKSSHQLLSVKIRSGDSLESYINFFLSKLSKVSNYGEEVSALLFISRLQVTHPLYKHLLNHNVAKTIEALSRAQPFVQLEEAIKVSSNTSTKSSKDGMKSKSACEALDYVQNRHRG